MSYMQGNGFFKSARDGKEIFYRFWKAQKPAAHIVFIHGAFEHSGRYENLLAAFQHDNISFWAMDLRGHGNTSGERGVAENVQQLTGDIDDFLDFLRSKHEVILPFVLGHSLGGLLVLSYASQDRAQGKIKGIITSGAALAVKMNFLLWAKQFLARFVLGKIAPGLTVPVGIKPELISHDQEIVRQYIGDSRVFDRINLGLAASIIEEGKRLSSGQKRIACRHVYMAHGAADAIAYDRGSKQAFEQVISEDKCLKIYPGLYHEIFNELPEMRLQVLQDLRNWLNPRLT